MSIGIGNKFIIGTRKDAESLSGRDKGLPRPALQKPYDPNSVLIDLPAAETTSLPMDSVKDVFASRSSCRDYSNQPLSLSELSYLLWTTQGVKVKIKDIVALRHVPSAGGRHALETYLLITNVHGLEQGLYRYLGIEHKLVLVEKGDKVVQQVIEACDQEFVSEGAVTFLWTAIVDRMTWSYGERGYRYLFLDAGHVCQNLYLAAEALGCGACAVGDYHDSKLNSVLNLDGEGEFVLYAGVVGKKQ